MSLNDTRAPPTITTTAELDAYRTTIDDVITRGDIRITSIRLSDKEHREMLDVLFKLPNTPRSNGYIARHFYDIVKSGHGQLYREYFPKLEERVVEYEHGKRDE